jgi:hypothetical protein
MSIMRRNKDQMEEMVRLSESLGANSVKFNMVLPGARGETIHDSGEALTVKELVSLGSWVENRLSASTDLQLFYSHPPAFKPMGKIFRGNGGGCTGICGIHGILGVLGNGTYALCGIGETVPDLVFGDAEKDPSGMSGTTHPCFWNCVKDSPGASRGSVPNAL